MLEIKIITHQEGADLAAVKALMREYEAFLGFSLDFQSFEAELASLPGKFSPPRGRLYLATWEGVPVGCTGFYEFSPGICELKRLFVKPDYQGKAIGCKLMERSIEDAAALGYRFLRLDSLHRLGNAEKLYQRLGFYEIPPYNENPYPDAYYRELALPVTHE